MSAQALERCVGDVETFACRHWGRAPMLRRAAAQFGDLLDVASIERLLTDLGRRPTFRLVREGGSVPVAEYTRRTRVGGAVIDGVADVDRILELVAAGATVVMQGLQRWWPPLARFCLDVEAELSHPVQANAYLSPPGAVGLGPHADNHHVLVLQVAGEKAWHVDGLGELTMTAGDVVYLPAGVRHAARTTRSMSLHITLGLLATTYREVLHRVVDGIEDAGLDRPLPLGFVVAGVDALADPLDAMVATATAALGELDVTGVAGLEIGRRRARARTRWTGRLEVVVDPASLDDDTVVRARGPVTLSGDGDDVVLDVPDRRLRLPSPTWGALDVIAACVAVPVGDLPGLDAADRAVLVRRLVREGIVEVVTPAV